jgi:hypothetical protein
VRSLLFVATQETPEMADVFVFLRFSRRRAQVAKGLVVSLSFGGIE